MNPTSVGSGWAAGLVVGVHRGEKHGESTGRGAARGQGGGRRRLAAGLGEAERGLADVDGDGQGEQQQEDPYGCHAATVSVHPRCPGSIRHQQACDLGKARSVHPSDRRVHPAARQYGGVAEVGCPQRAAVSLHRWPRGECFRGWMTRRAIGLRPVGGMLISDRSARALRRPKKMVSM